MNIVYIFLILLNLTSIKDVYSKKFVNNSLKNKNFKRNLNEPPPPPGPTTVYDSMIVLIEPDIYVLYWSLNQTDIIFEVHAKITNGWFSFGLSPNGNLFGADLVIGWINQDGMTGHFSDRHTNFDTEYAYIDSKQNWFPLLMIRTKTHIVFKFSRKLIICNSVQNEINLNISSRSVNLIYTLSNRRLDFLNDNLIDVISLSDRSLLKKGNTVINFFQNYNHNSNSDYCLKSINLNDEFKTFPTDNYKNYEELIPNKYKFYWNVTDSKIIIELHVKTSGWIGFGFSPNGEMDSSDVMIGWISDGKPYLTDRYIHGRRILQDLNNDLRLLYSNEINGFTILKYERNIILCDPDDRTIDRGSPFIIYAWSDSDPISEEPEDLKYHSNNKGSKQLVLINSLKNDQYNRDENNLEKIEFKIKNVVLTNTDTFYYCKMFKIPSKFKTKKHILKYELVLPTVNPQHIHHVFAYECVSSYNGDPKIQPGSCHQANIQKYCQSYSYVWTIGGATTTYLPKNTGYVLKKNNSNGYLITFYVRYPIGGDADYSFIVLEVHYNNPDYQETSGFIDSLSLNFYVSDYLQNHELGILALGTYPDPFGILIPPKLQHFYLNTYCFNSCIKKHLENQTIKFVIGTSHTHSAGRNVHTKLIRNNRDIGYVFHNKYYNYNSQNQHLIDPPIALKKDDSLITTCKWSTIDRDHLTKGGQSSYNEMCYQFLHYYPRIKTFKNCFSAPSPSDQAYTFNKLKREGYINYTNEKDNSISLSNLSSLYPAYDSLSSLNHFPRHVTNALISLYHNSYFYADCSRHTTMGSYAKIKPNKSNPHYSQCELIARPELVSYDLVEAADFDDLIRRNQADKQPVNLFISLMFVFFGHFIRLDH